MADFNCECEETSTYDTLLTLRTRMMVALGFAAQKANPPPGMADLIDGWLRDAQLELYQKNPSFRTERRFRWTMVEGEGFYGIRDNDTPPDFDDVDCGKHLNEYSIRAVWLEDLNGSFTPMFPGIPMGYLNSVDQLGFPSRGRWEEVFNSDAYDDIGHRSPLGNGGSIIAEGPPMDGFQTSAGVIIPANSVLVFARDRGDG
jgi:hypothetical protein